MLGMLKTMMPDPAHVQFDRLDQAAKSADVDVAEKSGDTSSTSHFKLVLEGGIWKIAEMM
jgi:hypothetical protein